MVVPYGAPESPHPRKFAFDSYVAHIYDIMFSQSNLHHAGANMEWARWLTSFPLDVIAVRDGWIISGSRRHLWLPPNYQGEWDSDETSIAVATNQGRVLRFLLRGTDETPALGDNDRGHQRICYQEFNFPLEEPEENGEECQNQKYA